MSRPEGEIAPGEGVKSPPGEGEDARGRLFWARILACGFVFGGLLVLSGVIVCGIYLLVWAARRG